MGDLDLDILRAERAGVVRELLQGESSSGSPAVEGGGGIFGNSFGGRHDCFVEGWVGFGLRVVVV